MADLAAEVQDFKRGLRELLMEAVAIKLTGRSCDVQLCKPAVRGTLGTVHRDGEKAVIQVDPDLPGDQTLRVFLHEVAHAKLHLMRYRSNKDYMAPAGSIAYDSGQVDEQDEGQAEELAQAWYQRATRSGDTLTQWLLNLLGGE